MKTEKQRRFFFWVSFILILAIPFALALMYNDEISAVNVEQFMSRQYYMTRNIRTSMEAELQKLDFMMHSARSIARYTASAFPDMETMLQTLHYKTNFLAGYALVRNRTILEKKTYNKDYFDIDTDSFKTGAFRNVCASTQSSSDEKMHLHLSTNSHNTYSLLASSRIHPANQDCMIAAIDLDAFHTYIQENYIQIEESRIIFFAGDGTVFYDSGYPNFAGTSISNFFEKAGIAKPEHLLSEGTNKHKALVRSTTNPETEQPEETIMSVNSVSWGKNRANILLLTPRASVLRLYKEPDSRIELMLALLLAITVFQGILYFKTRNKAVDATRRASAIPSLEETIRQSEAAKQRYHTLFHSIMDGIIMTDMENRIVECNRSFADMLGYTSNELGGMNQKTITPPRFWEQEEHKLREQLPNWGFTRDYEKEYMRKDGSIVPVIINATMIEDDETKENMVLSTIKDISSQKRAAKEIRKLHEHMQDIIESSPSAFITLNRQLQITSFNTTAEKLFNIKRRDILHSNISEAIPFFDNYAKSMHSVLERKDTISMNSEFFQTDNNEEKYVNITFYPLNQGESIAVHLEDITQNVKLETQLFQSQKMEAMGTLASGFAHDFNNLLTGMFSYLSFLKLKMHDDELLEKVDTLDGIAKRASSLVQHILTFSRKSKIHAQPVRVFDICKEVVAILARSIPKNIRLVNNVLDESIHVMADPSQISQVLLNLCLNARDAMAEGGQLSIDLDIVEIRQQDVTRFRNLQPGTLARISITDTGSGIPDDIQDKIFDPFFTTKVKGKGTGLGLSIVYGILRNHHGDISVTSMEDQGTRVSFYLPLAEPQEEQEDTDITVSDTMPPPGSGHGTVMIIDDEEVLLNALEDGFTRVGYDVYKALSGEEGLALFKEHSIDLVILDMIMPGLSGEETFDALQKIDENIKILVHTGFTKPELQKKMLEKGALRVIHKPYDIYELVRTVNTLLHQEQNSNPSET